MSMYLYVQYYIVLIDIQYRWNIILATLLRQNVMIKTKAHTNTL